jgi:hypothetical protein
MTKKRELWLAFAGDELTCTVSVQEDCSAFCIGIELAGTFTPGRQYVFDLIMDVVENTEYDCVEINARSLSFFSGNTVNDCAIETLLKLVCYFSRMHKTIHLKLEDGCVKDALLADLPAKKYRTVTFDDAVIPRPAKGLGARLSCP